MSSVQFYKLTNTITHLLGTYAHITNGVKCDRSTVLESCLDADTPSRYTLSDTSAQPVLRKRELEIVKLIANGYSSKQIAEHLCISYHIVNTHRQKMLEKTRTKNTGGLIQLATNNGMI